MFERYLTFSTSTFLTTGFPVVTNMDMATVQMACPQLKSKVSQKTIIPAIGLKQARNDSLSSAGDPALCFGTFLGQEVPNLQY